MSLRGRKPVSDDSGEGGSEVGDSESKSGASTPVRPVVGAGAEPLADAAGRVKLDRVPDLLFCCIKLSEGDPASLDLRRDLLTRIAKTRLLDGGEDGQMVRHEVTLTPRFARMVNQMAASLAKLSRGYKVNMKLASLMVCVAEMAEQLLVSDALAGAQLFTSDGHPKKQTEAVSDLLTGEMLSDRAMRIVDERCYSELYLDGQSRASTPNVKVGSPPAGRFGNDHQHELKVKGIKHQTPSTYLGVEHAAVALNVRHKVTIALPGVNDTKFASGKERWALKEFTASQRRSGAPQHLNAGAAGEVGWRAGLGGAAQDGGVGAALSNRDRHAALHAAHQPAQDAVPWGAGASQGVPQRGADVRHLGSDDGGEGADDGEAV